MKKNIIVFSRRLWGSGSINSGGLFKENGYSSGYLFHYRGENKVEGAHGVIVEADKVLNELENTKDYNGLVIPGGMPGATNLRDNEKVIQLVKEFNQDEKLIAAICAGPIVLEKAEILEGKEVTSYPGFEDELKGIYKEDLVVQDENIITARGPAVAVYFALKIVEYLLGEIG